MVGETLSRGKFSGVAARCQYNRGVQACRDAATAQGDWRQRFVRGPQTFRIADKRLVGPSTAEEPACVDRRLSKAAQ